MPHEEKKTAQKIWVRVNRRYFFFKRSISVQIYPRLLLKRRNLRHIDKVEKIDALRAKGQPRVMTDGEVTHRVRESRHRNQAKGRQRGCPTQVHAADPSFRGCLGVLSMAGSQTRGAKRSCRPAGDLRTKRPRSQSSMNHNDPNKCMAPVG